MRGHDEIVKSALDLPEEERARVVRKIIESFDGEPNADIERAWAAEVAQRIHDLADGRSRSVTAPEAFDRARSRIDNQV